MNPETHTLQHQPWLWAHGKECATQNHYKSTENLLVHWASFNLPSSSRHNQPTNLGIHSTIDFTNPVQKTRK